MVLEAFITRKNETGEVDQKRGTSPHYITAQIWLK